MTLDAGEELRRALGVAFVTLGAACEIEGLASRPWASVTFAGARHRLRLRLQGDRALAAADSFLDGLAEREFGLRGHILADIALIEEIRGADIVRLTLEALTVEAD